MTGPGAGGERAGSLAGRLAVLRRAGGQGLTSPPEAPARRSEPPGRDLVTRFGPVRAAHRRLSLHRLHGRWPLGALCPRWTPGALGALSDRPGLPSAALPRVLFLDTETTGLRGGAGTRAFLVGLAAFAAPPLTGGLEVEQLLLAGPGQEPALLSRLSQRLEAAEALVTFNGGSYDLPLLQSRAVLAGRPPLFSPPHLDLLPPARRLLGHGLPDSRLVSLESGVLGLERVDDLPGAEAPAAWFAWLRRGDTAGLRGVLRHNLLDLLSLVTLASALLELVVDPGRADGPRHDSLGLAEHQLRRGRLREARHALERLPPQREPARVTRQARLVKRLAGSRAAAALWRRLTAAPGVGPEPYEELAKVLEHHEGDPAAARAVVQEALSRFGRRRRVRERLEHRLRRLCRKLAGPGSVPRGHLSE